jgi:GNAT superfamily N-acetyltransferase
VSGTHPAIVIREAATKQDFAVFAALIGEYVEWCVSQCGNDEVLVREVFGSQMVGREMADPKAYYGRPHGCVFLAEAGGAFAGCGAYRALDATRCEMKRLFVRAAWRGSGTGRRLCQEIIASARRDGYRAICLDTMDWMAGARTLYRSLGFHARPPYREYPAAIADRLRFIELPLVVELSSNPRQ